MRHCSVERMIEAYLGVYDRRLIAGARGVIGYYAHHHGSGHVTRMQSIAAYLDEPVWGLSSLAGARGVVAAVDPAGAR